MIVELADERATASLAVRLLQALPGELAGWTLLLAGELGSGKSTFARAFIRALGHEGPVPSPTYTLVEPYELADVDVFHIDLYRVADEEELRYLGWSELDSGLRLVEWPERVPGLRHSADIAVELRYKGRGREAELSALSQRGAAALARLALPSGSKPAA